MASELRISRPVLILSLAVVLAVAGGATLAIGQSGGVVNTCYNSTTGDLRVITPAAPRECQANETALPLGSGPGPQGPQGPAGASGTDETASDQAAAGALPQVLMKKAKPLSLKQRAQLEQQGKQPQALSVYNDKGWSFPGKGAPGTGRVVASLQLPAGRWVIVTKATVWEISGHLNCVLQAGGDYDQMTAWESGMIAGNVVHRFKEPGRALLRCAEGDSGYLGISDIKLTAIEVGQLQNKPAPEAL
jgi:hypothetical protein